MAAHESPYGAIDPEIVGSWLASIDVAEDSKQKYEIGFRAWCGHVEACGYDFDELEESHVIGFKDHLLHERGLSPATVSQYLAGVRSFYRFASSRGLDDIARNVRGAKVSREPKRAALSLEQARELLALFGEEPDNEKDARDKAMISLMLHTGVRDIEVVRANKGDRTVSGGHEVLMVHGKGRDDADKLVKIAPSVDRDIRHYMKFRPKGLAADAPLFASVAPRNKGGRLTTRSVMRIVTNALLAIGIDEPNVTPHSLRHSAITFALMAGARLEDVQAMARHANIMTTMGYAHHVERLENAAENKVAGLLD